MSDLIELKRLAEAATKGLWSFDNEYVSTENLEVCKVSMIDPGGRRGPTDWSFGEQSKANGEFIAAANPAVILELLDELTAATAKIEALEKLTCASCGYNGQCICLTAKKKEPCGRQVLAAGGGYCLICYHDSDCCRAHKKFTDMHPPAPLSDKAESKPSARWCFCKEPARTSNNRCGICGHNVSEEAVKAQPQQPICPKCNDTGIVRLGADDEFHEDLPCIRCAELKPQQPDKAECKCLAGRQLCSGFCPSTFSTGCVRCGHDRACHAQEKP